MAAARLRGFTAGATRDRFLSDPMMQAAVKHEFVVIGEALSRLTRDDRETAGRLSGYKSAIGLRNIIAHNYEIVNPDRLWQIIRESLPALEREIGVLLAEWEARRGG